MFVKVSGKPDLDSERLTAKRVTVRPDLRARALSTLAVAGSLRGPILDVVDDIGLRTVLR